MGVASTRVVWFSLATSLACAQGETAATAGGATDFATTGATGDSTVGTSAGPAADPSTDTQGSGATSIGEASESSADSGVGPATCGNGIEEEGEACDDGDRVQADGCNDDCVLSGTLLWSHSQANGRGGTDQARGIAADDEDDAYVAGSVHTAATTTDAWLRRYDAPGGIEWTQTVDGAAMGDDIAYAVARDGGALFFAGQRVDGGTLDTWLARYDLAGNQAWAVTYDGGIGANDVAFGVVVTPGDEVVIAGHTGVMDQGNDVLVRKYSAAGDPVWTSTYGGAAAGNDRGYAIAADPDANLVVTGWETTGGMLDLWVRKYGPGGGELWTRGYAGMAGLDDQGFGVAVDAVTRDIVVVGVEGMATTTGRSFLRKYDLDGNEMWTLSGDGSTGEGASWRAVAIGVGGVIAVVGSETVAGADRIVVSKFAADSSPLWTTVEDAAGPAVAYAVAYVGDGLYVAGTVDKGVDGVDTWVGRFAP
jgi:cysteine-rich repeat protein